MSAIIQLYDDSDRQEAFDMVDEIFQQACDLPGGGWLGARLSLNGRDENRTASGATALAAGIAVIAERSRSRKARDSTRTTIAGIARRPRHEH